MNVNDTIFIMVLVFIVILGLLWVTPRSCMCSISSQFLPHRLVWESEKNHYNPSMTAHTTDTDNGSVLAIRHNYQHFDNWLSTVFNAPLKFENDLVLFHGPSYSRRTTLGINMEDPRIFYHDGTHYIIAVKYDGTNIIPHLITLHTDLTVQSVRSFSMEDFTSPYRQKNWVFFTDNQGQLLLLTDVHPELIIRKVDMGTMRLSIVVQHNTKEVFRHQGYTRCSTSFVTWKDGTLLCALHLKHQLTIRTLFFCIQGSYPYLPVSYSPLYHVQNKLIEFASGLSLDSMGKRLWLSLGIENHKGLVVELNPEEIELKLI